MKFIVSAALTLLVLVSGQSFAEQTPSAGQQNNRDTMIMPSTQNQSDRKSVV